MSGVSGKTGEGVADFLNVIVEIVPPPKHADVNATSARF